jgi:drug/metabolite transporter (DMT)-like permease
VSVATLPILSAARSAHRRAILRVLAASALFTLAAALVKAIGAGIPAVEMVLARSIVAIAVLLPLMRRQGGLAALRTRWPAANLLRGLLGYAALVVTFYGYTALPLAGVIALGFLMPLFVTILAGPALGERIGPARVLAMLSGLGGVALMLRPWSAVAGMALGPSIVVILGVVAWALTVILIRRLGARGESSLTIVVWYAIVCLVLSAAMTVPVCVTPSAGQLAVMVLVGVLSAAAQLLMTEGYRGSEASLLAPFEYGAIVYATALGALWGEWPDGWGTLGVAVIILSGLAVWQRGGGR